MFKPNRSNFVVFVPGIYTGFRPEVDNWTGKLNTKFFVAYGIAAQPATYLGTGLTGPVTQKRYGPRVAKMLSYLPPESETAIDAIGHSNAAGILGYALVASGRKIRNLFLFSPAVRQSMMSDIFLPELESGQLERLWIFRAGRDIPLRIARWAWFRGAPVLGSEGPGLTSGRPLDKWTWSPDEKGYGYLNDKVIDICVPEFHHSDWFDDQRELDQTFALIGSVIVDASAGVLS